MENTHKFKITLNREFTNAESIFPEYQYVVGCDPYKVEEPLNFWHKIKMKLGLRYKTKYVGWEYTVFRQSVIDGKIVMEYKGRE